MINIIIMVREADSAEGLLAKLKEWEDKSGELISIKILDQSDGIKRGREYTGDAIFVELSRRVKNSTVDLLYHRFNIMTIVLWTYHGDMKLYQKECEDRIEKEPATVEQIMNEIILAIFDEKSYFFFGDANKKMYVKLSEIIYMEHKKGQVKIHLSNHDECPSYRGVFSRVYERLDRTMFIRCHQSFIVSTIYIDFIEGNKIGLKECGQELPVSRKYRAEINKLKKSSEYHDTSTCGDRLI